MRFVYSHTKSEPGRGDVCVLVDLDLLEQQFADELFLRLSSLPQNGGTR